MRNSCLIGARWVEAWGRLLVEYWGFGIVGTCRTIGSERIRMAAGPTEV